MYEARGSTDREANLELWKQWAANVNESYTYHFATHTMWTNAYAPKVQNVCGAEHANGTIPICHVGGIPPAWDHMWIEQ